MFFAIVAGLFENPDLVATQADDAATKEKNHARKASTSVVISPNIRGIVPLATVNATHSTRNIVTRAILATPFAAAADLHFSSVGSMITFSIVITVSVLKIVSFLKQYLSTRGGDSFSADALIHHLYFRK
jgi:hypothetical protein